MFGGKTKNSEIAHRIWVTIVQVEFTLVDVRALSVSPARFIGVQSTVQVFVNQ